MVEVIIKAVTTDRVRQVSIQSVEDWEVIQINEILLILNKVAILLMVVVVEVFWRNKKKCCMGMMRKVR